MVSRLRARPPQRLFWPLLGALVLLAWFALAWLEQSEYGWLFHSHGGSGAHDHAATLPLALGGALFLAGWLLMTVAMMVPTTFPLVSLFRTMAARHDDATTLTTLLLLGYAAAWTAFGVVAFLLWSALTAAVQSSRAITPATATAVLFLTAGAFQFSSIKYACLDKCRTPLGFLASHWHGRRRRRESFLLGLSHGAFCVGCCWALMMLMFAASVASIAWMLLLAAVMGLEKNTPWGVKLARPLGVLLLSAGAIVGFYGAQR